MCTNGDFHVIGQHLDGTTMTGTFSSSDFDVIRNRTDLGVLFTLQADGLDLPRLTHLLYHESGLLGVSGRSASPQPRSSSSCGASCARSAR